MPEAEYQDGDVFENVNLSPEITSLDQVDLNNLVSNTHVKHATGEAGQPEFILHPGDKVTKKVLDVILKDIHMGEETFLEMIRRNSFVHKDAYVPDAETLKGSVESYNQPVFRNTGSPQGDESPDLGKQATPANPAEDKSTTSDKEAEANVAAKVAAEAAGSGKDTPAKK